MDIETLVGGIWTVLSGYKGVFLMGSDEEIADLVARNVPEGTVFRLVEEGAAPAGPWLARGRRASVVPADLEVARAPEAYRVSPSLYNALSAKGSTLRGACDAWARQDGWADYAHYQAASPTAPSADAACVLVHADGTCEAR